MLDSKNRNNFIDTSLGESLRDYICFICFSTTELMGEDLKNKQSHFELFLKPQK